MHMVSKAGEQSDHGEQAGMCRASTMDHGEQEEGAGPCTWGTEGREWGAGVAS